MITVSNEGGKPMARESFEPPTGFLVGTGEGAEVLLGGLAVQFKLRAGQTGGRLSITEMTLDPHRFDLTERALVTARGLVSGVPRPDLREPGAIPPGYPSWARSWTISRS
jgi:hypothetical protein